jgi:hypothetical protein
MLPSMISYFPTHSVYGLLFSRSMHTTASLTSEKEAKRQELKNEARHWSNCFFTSILIVIKHRMVPALLVFIVFARLPGRLLTSRLERESARFSECDSQMLQKTIV